MVRLPFAIASYASASERGATKVKLFMLLPGSILDLIEPGWSSTREWMPAPCGEDRSP
jgi:hypothetical protein